MQEIRDKKAIRHIKNKQHNSRSPSLLVISLNVNGLSLPIKGQRLAEQIKTHGPTICALPEAHFRAKDTNQWNVKGWKRILHANYDEKRTGGLILGKIDFK